MNWNNCVRVCGINFSVAGYMNIVRLIQPIANICYIASITIYRFNCRYELEYSHGFVNVVSTHSICLHSMLILYRCKHDYMANHSLFTFFVSFCLPVCASIRDTRHQQRANEMFSVTALITEYVFYLCGVVYQWTLIGSRSKIRTFSQLNLIF